MAGCGRDVRRARATGARGGEEGQGGCLAACQALRRVGARVDTRERERERPKRERDQRERKRKRKRELARGSVCERERERRERELGGAIVEVGACEAELSVVSGDGEMRRTSSLER